jgi:hypothetical protein
MAKASAGTSPSAIKGPLPDLIPTDQANGLASDDSPKLIDLDPIQRREALRLDESGPVLGEDYRDLRLRHGPSFCPGNLPDVVDRSPVAAIQQ